VVNREQGTENSRNKKRGRFIPQREKTRPLSLFKNPLKKMRSFS